MSPTPASPARGAVPFGNLPPLQLSTLPVFIGLFAYVGPGILWAALAQGSGELIFWPYITAKYGAAFLGLLIPAALLQYWLNLEICRYTIVTGETPMTGFSRIGRWFAWFAWILVFVENIWFGAYASAGGTALAALTGFPDGWTPRGQSLFWGYLTIAIYLVALVASRVAYTFVERFSMVVVFITMTGIIFAVFQEPVLAVTGEFFGALVPHVTKPGDVPNWDPADWNTLAACIAFAGAGGMGQLFIAYWMRDKGIGMGKNVGRVTSPITGKAETIPATGFYFADTAENKKNYKGWVRYFSFENGIGVGLNLATTIIMCWLAYALLLPRASFPRAGNRRSAIGIFRSCMGQRWQGAVPDRGSGIPVRCLAAAHRRFFRIQADFFYSNIKGAQKLHYRSWYYIFVGIFTVLTVVTMALAQPGTLIIIRGVVAFLAMAIIAPAFVYLNYVMLPKVFPKWVRPHPVTQVMMLLCTVTYMVMAVGYVYLNWAQLSKLATGG